MYCAAPPFWLMGTMNLLLLVAAHEPVEASADEVHQHGQRVKHVVARLDVKGGVWCLQGVFAEVWYVCWCLNARDYGEGCDDEGPVGEGDVERVPVHEHEVGDIACSQRHEAQPSHSLRCINLSLWHYLLLGWKVLQGCQFIELIRITLGCDVVNVVRPVLPQVAQVNGLFWH